MKTLTRLTGTRLFPEYGVWKSMRTRCTNPNTNSWHRYGGRGIKVCARWDSYEAFLEDMGRRPTPEHTLDRKDNDGDYEPDNCRWATGDEQRHNTRRNRWITAFGERLTIIGWEKKLNISHQTILRRLSLGATPEQAVSQTLRVFESTFEIDGQKLKRIRERCGLTQRAACELADVSTNYWNVLEKSGYNLRSKVEVVEKLAKGLGCHREEFTTFQPMRFE